jgi:hypothetical protein
MPTSPHERLVKKTFELPENAAGELQLKLGSVPADVETRLRQATLDELTRSGTRVLTAATLDEVFAA